MIFAVFDPWLLHYR